MRRLPLILALSLPALSPAEMYLSENFANYIPSAFTVVNADGGSMQPYIYRNMGDDPSAAWVAGQLADGYKRAALCPTRRADSDSPSDRRMILPPLAIGSPDAVVQWEARSLHGHIAESYRVAVRPAGADAWTDLYVCDAESPYWTRHSVSLSDYTDMEIEIAFIATTVRGFILAVDNIYVGVPEGDSFCFSSRAPHYVGEGTATVSGTLTYYGDSCPWTEVALTAGDEVQTVALPPMRCGDSAEISLPLSVVSGQRYDYKITARGTTDDVLLYSDFISCSLYPRTQVIDRGTGTWCPQCPAMGLTTDRLQRIYGDEAIIIESHINDALTNDDYWHSYLEGNVYSVPCLIPNHDLTRNTASLNASDDFSSALHCATIAKTEVKAWLTESGEVRAESTTEFAIDCDNSGSRYRMGYMLIGDIHDDTEPLYMQSLSAPNFYSDLYLYMPEDIMPEMMYYDNVPVSAETAYTGIPASLPQTISARKPMPHAYNLSAPAADGSNLRVLAFVIDSADGSIVNAAVAPVGDTPTGINDISTDLTDGEDCCYDIYGRRMPPSAKGLTIVKSRSGQPTIIYRR